MKIGEVLEKTGLTDRAVRLYIEHGLITPETSSSYSGRKNIEFSDEDVEKLRHISLLRKADFSLSQIKRISLGGDDASSALSEFITDKRERHASDGEILTALDRFSGDVTLEGVANALEQGGAEKLEIKDLYLTYEEENEKQRYLAWGLVFIIISSLAIVVPPIYYFARATYPKVDLLALCWHICWLLPMLTVLLIGIAFLIRYRRGTVNICSAKKRTVSVISIIIALILSFAGVFCTLISAMIPFVHSETTDIEDYLIIDEDVIEGNRRIISKLFPSCVPVVASNATKYHYYADYGIFPSFDIYAEWKYLETKDYEAEKARIDLLFPKAERKTRGDFECVYVYTNDDDHLSTCEAIFAYNDERRIVRYIMGDHTSNTISELSWE